MAASRKSRLAQLPAHPAFPLVAALWFAALIGLGGLVAALIGLPQLGTALLAVIALLGALGGALLGLLVGRKIYRSCQPVADISAKPVQRRRSPIYAHAELGEGGLDRPVEEEPEETELLLDTVIEDAATQFTPEAPEAFESPEAATSEAEPMDEPATFVPEEQTEEPAEEEAPEPAAPSEEQAFAEPESDGPANEPANETASELDNLSLLQLTRRLQGAVAAHRAARPKQPAPQAGSGMTGAAAPTSAPNFTPNFTPPPANPPRPEPDTNAGAQDEPSASAVHHPARKPFVETDELMAAHANEDSPDDETALGETYTSLLAMTASVRAQREEPVQDNESKPVNIAQEPAQTLATLDRVSAPRTVAPAPVRQLDPQDQALRDALLNLQQFTQHR